MIGLGVAAHKTAKASWFGRLSSCNRYDNYSPDLKVVAAILSLNELILDDLFSCHPLVGGAFFGE
jgi:hypothetical protein